MSTIKSILSFVGGLALVALVLFAVYHLCTNAGVLEVVTHRSVGNLLYDPYTTISIMGNEVFRF